MSNKILQFVPFSSAIDAGFWYQLTKKKLDVFKLDDAPVSINGFYCTNGSAGLPSIANIDYSAFDENSQIPPGSYPFSGLLINTNTLEEFKIRDKKELLQSVGVKIWEAIKSGEALTNPTLLQFLQCFTFADLKKYHYYYWIAFPALTYPEATTNEAIKKFCDYFTSEQLTQFLDSYDTLSTVEKTVFLVYKDEKKCHVSQLTNYASLKKQGGKILLGFADPSTLDRHPGWPLRNALALVAYHWSKEQEEWDVVCFRERVKDGKRQCEHSTVISVHLGSAVVPQECPDVVGWEKNKNKLAPRKVDMSANMDPSKLADAAVDLNLKLMRWRLSPDLQLENIKTSRCLLFGAGTLGCNVARCLLGWGVRKITFLDNSRVSYSNPVRQTLYAFEDCLQGGKPKATAAAEALKLIFPGVEANGKMLSVPMPGHTVTESTLEQVRSEVSEIEELIDSHDVIFLLMDTRESRWLPSLISAAKHKLVINAALGFDTFLVMRHGCRQSDVEVPGDAIETNSKIVEGFDLGCYFCNDIVAPGNSLQDRTLDQQCTVTRPGVSYVAAALAVELMVSVLQHPKNKAAPTSLLAHQDTSSSTGLSTDLGIVPHQIRGYLDRFQNTILTSRAFDRCTACSAKVVDIYKKDGFNFLLKAFNDPNYLEEVTGLSDLMTNISMDEIFALSDDDSV